MSIPKEPRQLMINIMYLVLTALLALNVSAEIFNAFKIVDNGLVKSNKAIDESNAPLPEIIKTGAKKKASLAKYAELISPSKDLASQMNSEIQTMIDELIDAAGDADGSVGEGDYITTSGGVRKMKGEKNKDVTTRSLVYSGKGEELKAKLAEFRQKMIELADEGDRATFSKEIPSIVDDETWKAKKSVKNWSEFNFKQMPVQATVPILRKFQNDVKSTQSAFLNYLAGKVGTTTEVVLDKYAVVSAPSKSYIIKGEKYTTDLFLGAFAGADSETKISISVNGKALPVNSEGIASFTQTANTTGKKTYTATASIYNPATDETKRVTKEFEYEVGERSVSVSASKMNVFYIGVDNPIEVSAAGVPSNQVKVSASGSGGATINKSGDGYVVRVTSPTPKGQFAKIDVSAPGLKDSKLFRVKRIPDPVPMLGKSKKSVMGNGEFKAYSSLRAALDNFDFDAKCSIKGFRFVYVAKRQDALIETNVGGKYTSKTISLRDRAKPGDRYFFENIKCSCPGDVAARDLGTIGITIK